MKKIILQLGVIFLFLVQSLNGIGQVITPGSVIASIGDNTVLNTWLGGNVTGTLLYRRSTNGASPTIFHSLCDGQGPTIVLFKTSSNTVFGGYNPNSWNSSSGWTAGVSAFLFNLTTAQKAGVNATYWGASNPYATYNSSSYGPTFGGGHDLHIDNTMNGGYINTGYSYIGLNGTATGSAAAAAALAGSGMSSTTIPVGYITEIEVYKITPGVPAGALNFVKATNLSGNYISVPHSSSLNLGADFTIEAWVNYTGTNSTIIDKGDDDYLLQLNCDNPGFAANKIDFYSRNTGQWVHSTGTLTQGVWTHVAVTLTGGVMTFYINGVASGTANVTYSQDNGAVNIGRQNPVSCLCNSFNGSMDELRIWNRALTDCEIKTNRNCELPNPTSQTGLAAYYKFNQGIVNNNNTSITTVTDASINGNTGTLVGFARTGTVSNFVAGTVSGTCAAYSTPAATITPSGITTICQGSSTTLTAGGGTSYKWYTASTQAGLAAAPVLATTTTVSANAAAWYRVGATNAAGCTYNSNDVQITVNPLPTITCPGNIVVNATAGQCGANVTYPDATATGTPVPTITYSIASGSFFSVGITPITVTATNSCGTVTCTFNVQVVDNQAPVLTVPANISVNNTAGICGAAVTYTAPTAADNCTGTGSGSQTFNYSNSIVNFVVPAGVNSITVDAYGAQGGSGTIYGTSVGAGGKGARMKGTIAVTPGETIKILVGQMGGSSGGPHGNENGGGGGSFVVRATGNIPLVIAGGGGGAPASSYGTSCTRNAANADGQTGTSGVTVGCFATGNGGTGGNGGSSVGSIQGGAGGGFSSNGGDGTAHCSVAYGGQSFINGGAGGAGNTCYNINNYGGFGGGGGGNLGGPGGGGGYSGGGSAGQWSAYSTYGGGGGSYNIGSSQTNTAGAKTGNGSVVITWNVATPPVIAQTAGLASGSTFPVGTTTNTFTATDAAGNVTTASFTVTVADNEAPTFSGCPSNISITATDANGAVVTYSTPVGADNCPGATTTRTAGLASGSTFPVGTTTVTHTVTDAAGLTATCSFTVTVTGVAPVINCPANITVNNTLGQCGANVSFAATETTGVPASTITYSIAPGSFFAVGTTTVTATATNAVGSSSCSFTVTVVDNTAPAISCQSNISVIATSATGAVVTYTEPVGTDNCSGSTTIRTAGLESGSTFPIGITTVTYTVTDAAGLTATCSFTITVSGAAPVINCPSNITVNNTPGQCGANVNFAATETTGVPASTITYSIAPGSLFAVGTTTVTATATNAVGSSSCSFTVTVVDNERPVITVCAPAQTVNLDANCGTVLQDYRSLLTASDNCTAANALVITQSPLAGTLLSGTGNTTIIFTVTDAAGNNTTCSMVVTKNDVTSPTITCPQPITVNNTPNQCGAVVNFSLPATSDNCAGSATTGVHVLNSGNQFFDYANNVYETQSSPGLPLTFNPTDGSKMAVLLQNCGSTHYMYQDVTMPVSGPIQIGFDLQYTNHYASGFSTNQFIAVEIRSVSTNVVLQTLFKTNSGDPLSKPMTHYSYDLSAYAGQTVRLQIIDAAVNNFFFDVLFDNITMPGSSLANGSFETGNYNGWTIFSANGSCGTWGIGSGLGVALAQTAGMPSGSFFPIGTTTNTFEATDLSGNKSSCSFTVTVVDNQAPVITCPANINVIATSAAGATVTYTAPVGTDNCPGAVTTLTTGLASGSTFPIGTTTVTHTVTDAAGLTAQCSFTITVSGLAPVINCPSNITVNNAAGQCGANVNFAATETTGIPASTITYSHAPGSFFPIGTTTVTATATNVIGTVSCSFTVTVTDNENPVINCPSNITHTADAGVCTYSFTPTVATATDNCVGVTVVGIRSDAQALNAPYPLGTTTITWTATDAVGRIATCNQTITVTDNENPTIVCPAAQIVNLDANCNTTLPDYRSLLTVSDNCTATGSLVITQSPAAGTALNGIGNITVTFTVTDASNNSNTCSIVVTKKDVTPPAITCPQPITVNNNPNNCGAVVNYTTPVASDNCTQIGSNSQTFNYSGSIVNFTVPAGVTSITVQALGAQGGGSGGIGGLGANIKGTIAVTPGQVLKVLVGGAGAINYGNSGGGGSYVVSSSNTPLIIAGGGGGASIYNQNGQNGQTGTSGGQVSTAVGGSSGNGGAGGNGGGNSGCGNPGNGGGGLLTNGGGDVPSGGRAFVNGGTGGTDGTLNCVTSAPGGFGGGGAGGNGGGGGGGYSGGAGGDNAYINGGYPGGGGGGSFNTGTNQSNTADRTGNGSVIISWAGTTSGVGSVATVQTGGLPSGSVFPIGTTTNTFEATDASGNKSTCSFTVTVVDNQLPVIVCPANINVIATSPAGANVTYTTPVGTDNCTGVTTVRTDGLASGSTFPIGVTTVTYKATDASGNTAQCSFTVTVVGLAPVIHCPSNIIVNNTVGQCGANVNFAATETTGIPASTITYSHAPGSFFPVGTTTVTATATNVIGSSSCTFTITVVDNQPPVIINLPSNITVNALNNNCSALVGWVKPTATDNCGLASLVSNDPNYETFGFTLLSVGVNTITYTATDIHGNITTASFTVTVVDNQPPIITGCPSTITVNAANGRCDQVVNWNPPTASDNCPGVSLSTNHISGETFPVGTTVVTYTATDHTGLVTICSFNVVVVDNQLPVIACAADISVNNDAGKCGATIAISPATATDNCPGVTVTGLRSDALALNADYPVGTTTITWTATDAHSNSVTCVQTITVTDTENPVITCAAGITHTADAGVCSYSFTPLTPLATDNCPGVTVTGVRNDAQAINAPYPVGTTIITWTATDAYGHSVSCTQTVTVTDDENPVINCPSNITHTADAGVCTYSFIPATPVATDNCPGVTVVGVRSDAQALNAPYPSGITTITWTATDVHGHSVSCIQRVTVTDNERPSIVCVNAQTIDLDANCGAVLPDYRGLLQVNDNCTAANALVITQSPAAGTALNGTGTITVSFTVTDAANNISTCSMVVTKKDVTPPAIVCVAPISVNNDPNNCGAVVTYIKPTATDNCAAGKSGVLLLANDQAAWVMQVQAGLMATNQFTNVDVFYINSGTPTLAQLNTYKSVMVWTDGGFQNAVLLGNVLAAYIDGGGGVVDAVFDNASIPVQGNFNTVLYRVLNPQSQTQGARRTLGTVLLPSHPIMQGISSFDGGSSSYRSTSTSLTPGSYTIARYDNGELFIMAKENVSTGNARRVSLNFFPPNNTSRGDFWVSTTDGSKIMANALVWAGNGGGSGSGSVTVNQTGGLPSGSVFPIGTTTNTFEATDASGNTSTCSFTVTVTDNQPPVINCPANINVYATSAAGAAVTYATPLGTDNCSATTALTAGLASGSTFPIGVTTVTHTVTDAAGLTAECSFTVTVTGLPPVINCPPNIIVNNTPGQCGTNVSFEATETTAIPASVITYSIEPGSFFPVGTTTVTATATNPVGTVSCTFTVTVVDNEKPTIVSAGNQTQNVDLGDCGANVTVVAPATGDNCGVASVTNNYNGTADASGHYPVGTTTVIWTVIDIHGNSQTTTQDITVTDNEKPTIVSSGNQTQTADQGDCGANVTVVAPATSDNCSVASVTNNYNGTADASGHYPVGTTTVIWTVTDIHGNTQTTTQNITVTDDEHPIITNCPSNITVYTGLGRTTCDQTATWMAPTATDNCGLVTVSSTHNPGDVFPVGTTTVTYTFTDSHNNTSTCSFTVTVVDNTSPALIGILPGNTTGQCLADVPAAPTETSIATLYLDNCTAVTALLASTTTVGDNCAGWTRTYTYTITDANGNSTTGEVVYSGKDNTAPVITAAPANITVECPSAVPVPAVLTAMDNCSGTVAVVYNEVRTNGINNRYTLTRTWTASDACGNTSVNTQVITVMDTQAPVPNVTALTTITGQCSAGIVLVGNCQDDCRCCRSVCHCRGNDCNCRRSEYSYSGLFSYLYSMFNNYYNNYNNWDDDDDHGCDYDNDDHSNGSNYAYIQAPTATDNCTGTIIGTTTDPLIYTTQGTYTIHWKFDDGNGNISIQTQTVIVNDNIAPVPTVRVLPTITGQCSVTIESRRSRHDDDDDDDDDHYRSGDCYGNAYVPTAKDNCAGIIKATTTDPLSYNVPGTYIIHWTYNDGHGNITTQNQTVIVKDNVAPKPIVKNLPTLTGACSVTVSTIPKAKDNCVGLVIGTTTDPLTYTSQGTYTIRWTYNDGHGNIKTQNQTVIVDDNSKPVISDVADKTVNCGISTLPATTGTPTATDNCSVVVTYSDAVNGNTITRTWRATDPAGNYSTSTQKITTVDNTKPAISDVADITINCGTSTAPAATGTAAATDNCSTPTVSYTDVTSGYTITRTWKATDASGNYNTSTQTITIVDAVKPTITAPNDITINCNASTHPSSCGGNAIASDNCSSVTISYTDNTIGNKITRTWKATDASGNFNTDVQLITVVDNTRPTISDESDITVSCGASTAPSACGTPNASDNCGTPTVTYNDVTSGNKITRTWTATDAAGNFSTSTQIITIVDNTKPVISDVADVTVNCNASTMPASTGTAAATDNCSAATVSYTDIASGNKITRTWKATDASGNYSTSTQTITIGSAFTASVNSAPTSSVYTGGDDNNLYLGYGAQSTALQVCALPSAGAPYTYSWSGSYTNRLNSTTSAAPVFTPTTFGYYTFNVTVTNKYGCTSSSSISICVTDIRVPGTNGTKVYVCHKASGKYGTTQTLQVSINSVSAHIGSSSCGSNGNDRLGSCDQSSCNTTVTNSVVTNSSSVTKEGVSEIVITSEEELKVTAMPNPSTTYFTLKLESKYETPVTMRVMDAQGRVVDARSKIGANSTIQIGHSYSSGTYYAELIQGTKRKVVQLVKGRG